MKEVADGCFQQLYGEIVRSMLEYQPSQTKDTNATPTVEEEAAHREAFIIKLEAMGYDVGSRFAERIARDRPRMVESLDVIKFVCKDFWIAIFKKQIDKLQTNHRGVFVVQDFHFRWLAGISAATDEETREKALVFLVFPCGIIRGALANLGLTAIVNADIPDVHALPGCLFNIKLKQG
ncbi:Transport protein particle (TRAPP) complex subunit [Plasmopara halstedii]|uniref:Transport protein particle (TRAPP) complex subunit n=1 Tax=Plasmopara halstedii TaxID=4781 RepID=A0A0P1ARS5_PLAHL|nr:Transport protein particle (TRAPP) complex subunit [Plasmopara halstedii]CEG44208.1 Transport protein particle (TRAPP) complex subunit [Plasmopara halstedii]|eukprot:XP_024580577.1 Transport protein particle (TRAPP) complex subunit [Plasmopara halstedii]